jgi:hypothetical protein
MDIVYGYTIIMTVLAILCNSFGRAAGYKEAHALFHTATCPACKGKPQPKVPWYLWLKTDKILQKSCPLNEAELQANSGLNQNPE